MNWLRWPFRAVFVVTLALVLIGFAAAPSPASFRGHVVVGVGPFWWGPYPYWWGPHPYWWYAPPYVYYPPPVIVQEPPIYIQQPAPPEPPAGPYWYYCPSAQGYYPTVAACPEPWIKVPPRPQ